MHRQKGRQPDIEAPETAVPTGNGVIYGQRSQNYQKHGAAIYDFL